MILTNINPKKSKARMRGATVKMIKEGGRNLEVHSFKRFVDKGNFSASSSNDTFGVVTFALSDMVNYTEFTALFDQYRITNVRLILIGQPNDQETGPTPITTPVLLLARDFDDNTAWTSAGQAFQYEDLTFVQMGKRISFSLKPRIAVAAYSGTFTSYANMSSQWIDAASTNVAFFGVKWCIQQVSSGAVSGWRCYCEYDLECRSVI